MFNSFLWNLLFVCLEQIPAWHSISSGRQAARAVCPNREQVANCETLDQGPFLKTAYFPMPCRARVGME
jgi:hypothetical protein